MQQTHPQLSSLAAAAGKTGNSAQIRASSIKDREIARKIFISYFDRFNIFFQTLSGIAPLIL